MLRRTRLGWAALVCACCVLATLRPRQARAEATASSYLSQARKLLAEAAAGPPTGATTTGRPRALSSPALLAELAPSAENPGTVKLLRESVAKATELINNYRQNGLSNMPSLPALPGLNTVLRVPDKLLRAELSMLQDEIRMAQEMMQNPIAATMNAPRDLANMLSRMAEQLEQ